MFEFLKRKKSQVKFDRKVLRKNNISLLPLDERWNSLFTNTPKTPDIVSSEEKLKALLKEQSRLTAEAKEISLRKKYCMDMIIQLTPDAYDKNESKAQKDMQSCKEEIKRINERMAEIEGKLDSMPDRLGEINLELLEHTVNVVYFKIGKGRKRAEELDKLIEVTRDRLKEYIEEKAILTQDDTDIYSYFHDLLGAEELERLDKMFF